MDKNELIAKLHRVDEDAFFANPDQPQRRSAVVVIGGSALLLCDLSSKPTTVDVDIFQIAADNAARSALLSDPTFNTQSCVFCQNIPYNFEDRLQRIELDTLAIDYFVPSPEDLAVMKLYRWSPMDETDLSSPAFLERINWDLLDKLVFDPEEAEASRSAPPEKDRELNAMRYNYEQFRKKWRK